MAGQNLPDVAVTRKTPAANTVNTRVAAASSVVRTANSTAAPMMTLLGALPVYRYTRSQISVIKWGCTCHLGSTTATDLVNKQWQACAAVQ